MPDTAKLMSANSDTSIHAYKPDEDRTLCGLVVVDPQSYDGEAPPPRSADITGARFYTGIHRLMCERCLHRAPQARKEVEAVPIVDLVG